MRVNDRDRQIILTISRFSQLSSSHVRALCFEGNASTTPATRALSRLVDRGFLKRIERRMFGGINAGSGQYVYQLGSAGWDLARREGRYWPYRAVNYHTLAIADTFVSLKQYEKSSHIKITGLSTEPDTWSTIAGAELRPDMLVELDLVGRQRSLSLWIEIDLGTERQKQIKDKLARYWHAYNNVDQAEMPVFPVVLFIAPDPERARELNWIIDRGVEESRDLFLVMQAHEFPQMLL
jgi:hypothetical protein